MDEKAILIERSKGHIMSAIRYNRNAIAARILLAGLTGFVATAWAQAALAGDAAQTFDELYGAEAREVAASKDTRDAVDFAQKLFDRLQDVSDTPALREYVLNKIIEFGMKDSAGFAVAIKAAEKLLSEYPACRKKYQNRLLEIFQARYEKAEEYDKFDAGEEYVRKLLAYGDELMRPGPSPKKPESQNDSQTSSQPTASEVSNAAVGAAMKYFKTALAVAETIKSNLEFDIQQRIDSANDILDSRK